MYIPELNTYFIHIPKCGGTSVEMYFFNKVCGFPNLSPPHIFKQLGRENGSRYHFGNATPERLPTGETQHLSAWQLKQWDIKEFTHAAYTFAFVRNPWHRFVSETMWKQQNLGMTNHTFEAQVRLQAAQAHPSNLKITVPHNMPQWKFVFDENNVLLVDDVFKLEEMQSAEVIISEKLGRKVDFGHVNKTQRKDYSEYLTTDIKNALYPYIKKDLEIFNYD